MTRTLTAMTFMGLLAFLAACNSFDQADPITEDLSIESNAAGLLHTSWPSAEDPGLPFYARIEPIPPYVYHDGDYAAIVFYREPELIPDGFNLLTFFDPPTAFAVPLTVAGINLWHGQVGAGSPKVVNVRGQGAVPVWFVPAAPLMALIDAQGQVLTMADLREIEGLLAGRATHLQEVNHPHPLPPELGGGGHPIPKLTITARGTLEGGGRFELHLRGQEYPSGWQRSARIRLR